MHERLARLEQQVRALEDISAIKTLKYRYLRACDQKQPETVRDCLLPDGAIIAYEGFPPFDNRDAFVEIFRQMACRPNIIDMHHAANPEIHLTGPDTAAGTWDLFFHSIDTVARTALQMACVYTDDYVRQDNRWWISRTTTRRTSFMLQKIGDDGAVTVPILGTPPDAPFGTAN
jgi:hypothetical protein